VKKLYRFTLYHFSDKKTSVFFIFIILGLKPSKYNLKIKIFISYKNHKSGYTNHANFFQEVSFLWKIAV